MKVDSVLALALLALCGARSAHAQGTSSPTPSPSPSPASSFQDEVTVTASRAPRSIADAPVSVTVLEGEDVHLASAASVADLLRQVPGFAAHRVSSSVVGRHQTQLLAFRGLSGPSSRGLVLVDGVPLNDPYGGWVYWSRVPLESVERVEIVRGGSASVWGNLALSGVVQILTRPPEARTLGLRLETGGQDTRQATLWAGHVLGRWSVGFSGDSFETDGYSALPEEQRGPIDGTSTSDHRGGELRFDYRHSPQVGFSLRGSLFGEERGDGVPDSFSRVRASQVRAGASVTRSDGSRFEATGFVSGSDFHTRTAQVGPERSAVSPGSEQVDGPADALGASVQWSRALGARHALVAGADVQRVEAAATENLSFLAGRFTLRREAGAAQRLIGLFVEDAFVVGPQWRVTGALRLDGWWSSEARRRDTDLRSGQDVRVDAPAPASAAALGGSLGALHRRGAVSFRGVLWSGFRAPSVLEQSRTVRMPQNVITEANFALQPERLHGVEAGVGYASARLRAAFTGYWQQLEDPMTVVTVAEASRAARVVEPCGLLPANTVCRQRENIGRLRSRGLEVDLSFTPATGWHLGAGYALTQVRVLDGGSVAQLEGKQGRHAPRHQLAVHARYSRPRGLAGSLQGRFIGRRFEDDLNRLEIAGSLVWDAHAAYVFGRRCEAFLDLENLSDASYEVARVTEASPLLGGPRLVRVGLRLRY